MEFTHDEQRELASFGLLTRKPILTVFNMGEGQPAPDAQGKLDHPSVALMGKLEMEIAQLSAEDAAVFMEEYGIKELSLNRMINLSYDLLQVQTFFTVGEDEVRAWPIPDGTRAQDAAGTVHSDIARGFIRAEVNTYGELVAVDGSFADLRARGQLRLEGKEYVVRDGEVCHFRFNIGR